MAGNPTVTFECDGNVYEVEIPPFPFERAVGSYSINRMVPEESAELDRRHYYEDVQKYAHYAQKYCDIFGPERIKSLIQSFAKAWLDRYLDYLSTVARVPAAHVVGPARMPSQERLEKLHNTLERKRERLFGFLSEAKKNLDRWAEREKVKQIGRAGVLEEEISKLREELEKFKRWHEVMKEANKIIRSKNLTKEEKERRLREIGAFEVARAGYHFFWPEPDELGRIGFPDFELESIRNKIKRLEKRIEELERKKKLAEEVEAKGGQQVIAEGNGWKIIASYADDRVWLVFSGPPKPEVRTELKRHGFRWSPTRKAWVRKLTDNALTDAAWVIEQYYNVPGLYEEVRRKLGIVPKMSEQAWEKFAGVAEAVVDTIKRVGSKLAKAPVNVEEEVVSEDKSRREVVYRAVTPRGDVLFRVLAIYDASKSPVVALEVNVPDCPKVKRGIADPKDVDRIKAWLESTIPKVWEECVRREHERETEELILPTPEEVEAEMEEEKRKAKIPEELIARAMAEEEEEAPIEEIEVPVKVHGEATELPLEEVAKMATQEEEDLRFIRRKLADTWEGYFELHDVRPPEPPLELIERLAREVYEGRLTQPKAMAIVMKEARKALPKAKVEEVKEMLGAKPEHKAEREAKPRSIDDELTEFVLKRLKQVGVKDPDVLLDCLPIAELAGAVRAGRIDIEGAKEIIDFAVREARPVGLLCKLDWGKILPTRNFDVRRIEDKIAAELRKLERRPGVGRAVKEITPPELPVGGEEEIPVALPTKLTRELEKARAPVPEAFYEALEDPEQIPLLVWYGVIGWMERTGVKGNMPKMARLLYEREREAVRHMDPRNLKTIMARVIIEKEGTRFAQLGVDALLRDLGWLKTWFYSEPLPECVEQALEGGCICEDWSGEMWYEPERRNCTGREHSAFLSFAYAAIIDLIKEMGGDPEALPEDVRKRAELVVEGLRRECFGGGPRW